MVFVISEYGYTVHFNKELGVGWYRKRMLCERVHTPLPHVMIMALYVFSIVNPPATVPLEPVGLSQHCVVLSLVAALFVVHGSILCLMVRCQSLLRRQLSNPPIWEACSIGGPAMVQHRSARSLLRSRKSLRKASADSPLAPAQAVHSDTQCREHESFQL